MGSTVCVSCSATLLPHSYCDVCGKVLLFACSSCSLHTDERIHTYCRNAGIEYARRVSEMNKIWLYLFSNFWLSGYQEKGNNTDNFFPPLAR